jgi:Family of unknown function (DUF5317)
VGNDLLALPLLLLLILLGLLGRGHDLRSNGIAHDDSGYRTLGRRPREVAVPMIGGVLLLGSILLIGLLLGWGFGGSLRNLAHVRVGLWFLFPVALLLQVIPVPQGQSGAAKYLPFAVLELSYLVLVVAVAANWRLRGFRLILMGLLLNIVPITVNQGMPVSGSAVADAGGKVEDVPRERGAKHHLATAEDQLTFLGDVIAIREPFRTVVSVGDLVMYAGAAWFLAAAMLGVPSRAPRVRSRLGRRPQPSTMWESPR